MTLEGVKVGCLNLPGNFAWDKTVILPGIFRCLAAGQKGWRWAGTWKPRTFVQGSSAGSAVDPWGERAGAEDWLSVLERCQLFGLLNAAVELHYTYFGDEGECVFVFNFRLALVWSRRLNAPLLLKGVRCIPGAELEPDFTCKKPHQYAWRLLYAANQSTEVGTSRILFKARSCPQLIRTPAWGHRGGCWKTTRDGVDFDTSQTQWISKNQFSNKQNTSSPQIPQLIVWKQWLGGGLDLTPSCFYSVFHSKKTFEFSSGSKWARQIFKALASSQPCHTYLKITCHSFIY